MTSIGDALDREWHHLRSHIPHPHHAPATISGNTTMEAPDGP